MGIYCFLSVDTMHPCSLSFWGTCSSSFRPSPSNPWFPWKPPNSYKAILLISPLISPGVGTFPAKPFRTLPWAMLTTKKRLSTPLWYIGTTQGNEKPSVVSCPMEKTSMKENEGNSLRRARVSHGEGKGERENENERDLAKSRWRFPVHLRPRCICILSVSSVFSLHEPINPLSYYGCLA